MHTNNLNDVLHTLLCNAYDMEKQITKALPKMAKAASHPSLKSGFEQHLKETENQIERLERAHELLDWDIKSVTCEATKAIIEEGETMFKGCEEGPVRDAALVIAAQMVEHAEIAAYGSMIALARSLGHTNVADVLEPSLREEKATDEKLIQLAEGQINREAVKKAA